MKKIEYIRHSLSHILASAVLEFYPKAKIAIGPVIENGFYYDIDFDNEKTFKEEDLKKIEEKMKTLIKEEQVFTGKKISKSAAKKLFKDNPYKLEIIDELPGKNVSIYQNGNFFDLCRGGHVENTKEINPKAFKLIKVAGAYWRGSEKNKMLTRIYGIAFQTEKELENYLEMQKEAEKRDHRTLGEQLEIYTTAQEVGPGLILWLPKGVIIRQELEKWALETEKKWGYHHIVTPHITKAELYKISGHLPYYKQDLYSPFEIEGESYYLKPMNCPHANMIYKSHPRSYRELPLRLAEYGQVYRHERSGTLHGLMRTRGFCQNDAHIYVQPEKAVEEFVKVFNLHKYYYKKLGIKKWWTVLGVRDSKDVKTKYHGNEKMWKLAEKMTKEALKKTGIDYFVEKGGAAHYGPKVDIYIKSSIGKDYAIGTAQLDLYMPERFKLSYIDKNGKEKTPYLIHRAPLGSHERMIGFLLEHYGGAFPLWLSPIQVFVISISDKHLKYAEELKEQLEKENIRVELKGENETVSKKIREGKIQKIPYLIVVGDKEVKSQSISVRQRGQSDIVNIKLAKFIKKLKLEIITKTI